MSGLRRNFPASYQSLKTSYTYSHSKHHSLWCQVTKHPIRHVQNLHTWKSHYHSTWIKHTLPLTFHRLDVLSGYLFRGKILVEFCYPLHRNPWINRMCLWTNSDCTRCIFGAIILQNQQHYNSHHVTVVKLVTIRLWYLNDCCVINSRQWVPSCFSRRKGFPIKNLWMTSEIILLRR